MMTTPDAAAIALLRTLSAVTALTSTRISTDYLPGSASIRVTRPTSPMKTSTS